MNQASRRWAAGMFMAAALPASAANLFEFDAQGRLLSGRIESGFSSEAIAFRFLRPEGVVTVLGGDCKQLREGRVECWLRGDSPLLGHRASLKAKGQVFVDNDPLLIETEHFRRRLVINVL